MKKLYLQLLAMFICVGNQIQGSATPLRKKILLSPPCQAGQTMWRVAHHLTPQDLAKPHHKSNLQAFQDYQKKQVERCELCAGASVGFICLSVGLLNCGAIGCIAQETALKCAAGSCIGAGSACILADQLPQYPGYLPWETPYK